MRYTIFNCFDIPTTEKLRQKHIFKKNKIYLKKQEFSLKISPCINYIIYYHVCKYNYYVDTST